MTAPPGALILVVAYGAGLMTGLSRFLDLVVAIPVLLAAVWVLRRSSRVAIPLMYVIGLLVAAWSREHAMESCAARLRAGEQRLVVRTVEPGINAGRVTVPGRDCHGELMARWPARTHIGAGHDVTVVARWLPRPAELGRTQGLLVVKRVVQVAGAPGTVDSLRTSLVSASAALFGDQAPLVDALITGRRGGLDPALAKSFAAAGLVHLLAISGSHIAVIAGWVLLLLRTLQLPRHRSEAIAVIAAVGYTAFIGWPPSAVRAAALLALLAFCRWRQRHVRSDALLAASALLVLCYDPWAIVDIGAWLSVLALAGVSAATRWSDQAIGTRAAVRTVSGSVGATLTTAPLTAYAFGQVAPIGIVLNLVAVPLTAILVPLLLVALLLWHFVPVAAQGFATSGWWLLKLLAVIASAGAGAPGAATEAEGGWRYALPWLAGLLLANWFIAGRSTPREALRRVGWAATAVVWLLLLAPQPAAPRVAQDGLTLLFVDVGQGDAALIRTPHGYWVAVDAGPVDLAGRDAGTRILLPLLARERVARLEALIISHAHRDHVGGARALIDQIPVGVVIEPGEAFSDSAYEGMLTSLSSGTTRWHPARRGERWLIDGVEFRVLHPPAQWPHEGEDLNEDSVVLRVSYRDFRALLMGDAGMVAESALGSSVADVDLLKVGHHGSRGASGDHFLAASRPAVGIISVGRNNYGHPAPAALERLVAAGIRLWRTDVEGTTIVTTDGTTFTVLGGRTSATFAASARTGPRRRRARTPPRTHQGHHARTLHSRAGTRSPRCHW